MILPGDVIWDRYRVVRVETERAGRAWLEELSATPGLSAHKQVQLLLPLNSASGCPLVRFLAALHRNQRARSGAISVVNLDGLGAAEFHGGESAVVLFSPSARENLAAQLESDGPLSPFESVAILRRLLNSLIKLNLSWAKLDGVAELRGALARLLSPISLGLAGGENSRGLAFCAPDELPECGIFNPPRWSRFAAPELIRNEACNERALIFALGQLGRAMLLGIKALTPASGNAWTQFSQDVLGKRDPSREFLSETSGSKIPEELRSVIAKCLKAKASMRFSTLAKFRSALPELIEESSSSEGKLPGKLQSSTQALAPGRALPPGMALVESGSYLAGEKKLPRTLRAFAIDLLPVTEKAYKQYLKDLQITPRPSGPGTRPSKFDDHPAVNATWREAEAFAEHYGKRLPTIHEWEKAARGTDGRKYPYGDSYVPGTGKLRTGPSQSKEKESQRGTSPAGSFPLGASPYGLLDMAGNVLEWTSTGRRQGQRMFRALKGACFLDGSPELSRCTSLQYRSPDSSESCIGFRCVKDLD